MEHPSKDERPTLLVLVDHLLRHPKNATVPELEGKVPDGNVVAFIEKHPLFFELQTANVKTPKVLLKQLRSHAGYSWRMCADFYFNGKCAKDQACNFWHGPNDQRETPVKKRAQTATSSTANDATLKNEDKQLVINYIYKRLKESPENFATLGYLGTEIKQKFPNFNYQESGYMSLKHFVANSHPDFDVRGTSDLMKVYLKSSQVVPTPVTPATNQSQSKPVSQPTNDIQANKQTPTSSSNPAPLSVAKDPLPPSDVPEASQPAKRKRQRSKKKKNIAVDSNTNVPTATTTPSPVPVKASVQPTSPLPLAVPSTSQPKRTVEGKPCYIVPKDMKCAEALHELMKSDVLAIDCEGVNLGPFGKLCLIQIATHSSVFVFDMCHAVEREKIVASLKPLFMNENIKKILHDARNDNEALYTVGIENKNYEDTQILYGLLSRMRGTSENKISLKELMQRYGFDHELKSTIQANYKSDPQFWANRPLTEEMIQYAACDVANLAFIYKKIKEDIEKEINMMSINYATPKQQKVFEKTYADAIKIQLDVKLRLFFTPDKKPDRKDLSDVPNEEVAPIKNNTNERGDNKTEEKILLDLLPEEIQWAIETESRRTHEHLTEIIIDMGRVPKIRFTTQKVQLAVCGVVEDMDPFVNKILSNSNRTDFNRENRIGIKGCLHRISAIKNIENNVTGLTYRVGRHLPRSAAIITDLIARVAPSLQDTAEYPPQSASILLLGPPGVGKTTLLREISRLLADEYDQNVIIIDTSNEIGGDGDVAHDCIGEARRMPVVDKSSQHNTMVEAVQNHSPTVIVIDEIGTPKEAAAAKTISQRGVSLIGTAHGTSFDSLMKNPELVPLLGGIREVFLSDREATKNEDGTMSKVKHERGGSPTFNIIIEIMSKTKFRIYDNVATIVDAKLNRKPYVTELRWFEEDRMYAMLEKHDPLFDSKKKPEVAYAYANNNNNM